MQLTIRKILPLLFSIVTVCNGCSTGTEKNTMKVRGWNILSDNLEKANHTIEKAADYQINHLQLSHNIVMNLNDIRKPGKQDVVNALINKAHKQGIAEVTLWDHALYPLKYYPDRFKTGPQGTLDLDNPDFWKWFKQDYREMLGLVPEADGLILTFIETGARAEKQYSAQMTSEAEKLAAVINNIADIVIGELNKKLYIRTFAYNDQEYECIMGSISHLKYKDIILMMKESQHDFFFTHPDSDLPGKIARPTIIEFDEGNEYSGQGIIANTWPEYVLKRAEGLLKRKHVIGYVARTDRYGSTSVVGTPGEILLYALARFSEDASVSPDAIYDGFITEKYGKAALPYLKPAFRLAFDIVSSSLYTLGTSSSNHSALNYDPYSSTYTRHVSGRWIDPPVVFVGHGINREFHYWKDIVEHLAPARVKKPGAMWGKEAPLVHENRWISPEEKMTEEYLDYILREKHYGVQKAEEALHLVEKAESYMEKAQWNQIYQLFYRTLLTARLHESVCKAYFGYRIYARGASFRSATLHQTIEEGLEGILTVTEEMESYTAVYPKGQWNWKRDTAMARNYYRKIKETGWPEYGNCIFK